MSFAHRTAWVAEVRCRLALLDEELVLVWECKGGTLFYAN